MLLKLYEVISCIDVNYSQLFCCIVSICSTQNTSSSSLEHIFGFEAAPFRLKRIEPTLFSHPPPFPLPILMSGPQIFAGSHVGFSPKALEFFDHFLQLVSVESYRLPLEVIECKIPILFLMTLKKISFNLYSRYR